MVPKFKSLKMLKTTKDGIKYIQQGPTALHVSLAYRRRKDRRRGDDPPFTSPRERPFRFERYRDEAWLRKHSQRYHRLMRQVQQKFAAKAPSVPLSELPQPPTPGLAKRAPTIPKRK